MNGFVWSRVQRNWIRNLKWTLAYPGDGSRAEAPSPPSEGWNPSLVNPLVVYHFLKVSGKSGWKGIGTLFFVSLQWRIPGSRGLKVLALFRSSWNLKVLVFKLRRKPEYPEKNLSEQGDNQKQPLPTDGVDAEIWTRVRLVECDRLSPLCRTLDPFFGNFRKMIGNFCTPFGQHPDFFFSKIIEKLPVVDKKKSPIFFL